MRYFIQFSYRGTNFFGFQAQPNVVSVQETLTKALQLLLKDDIEIVGAGRTDTGVHAKEMFAHFDTDTSFDANELVRKINSYLLKDIAVQTIFEVEPNLHARFDAKNRTYEYLIHQKKNPFLDNLSWYYSHPLSIEKMNEASKILLEYTDFECFSKVHTDVKTFNCIISKASWELTTDGLRFTITADRFLRNMVRAIVGTLINVGLEKITIEDFRRIIESKNRGKAGFSVPACGLYLIKVNY